MTLDPAHPTCGPLATITLPCTQCSLMLLKCETHNVWLKIRQKEMEGKGTGKCYLHQVWNYRVWFEEEQLRIAASNPLWMVLPTFPITAAKVATFLHNKSMHEKVCLVSALPPCHLTEQSHAAQARKQVRDS